MTRLSGSSTTCQNCSECGPSTHNFSAIHTPLAANVTTAQARKYPSIGRSPDAGVFLDDVTVSRNHALLVRRRDGLYIDDLGSLNGTYVNRRRIESHRLADGDEIQVGKYKLSYLER